MPSWKKLISSAPSGAANVYWERIFGLSGSNVANGEGNITTDSARNVILTFRNGTAYVSKWDADGNEVWTYNYTSGASLDDPHQVVCDSNDNIYVTGRTNSSNSAGSQDMFLFKLNSSGVLQWTRLWGDTGNDNGRSLLVDSSDNIILIGNFTASGDTQLGIAKFNSSGTVQSRTWWESTSGNGTHDVNSTHAIDSNDNIYLAYSTGSSNGDRAMITKFNSSLAHQWTRAIATNPSDRDARGHTLALDSNENPYLGYYNGWYTSRYSDFFVTKFNTSGTAQWTRGIGQPQVGGSNIDMFEVPSRMAFDSSDILHLWFRSGNGSSNLPAAAGYNTSGVLQYEKWFTHTGTGQVWQNGSLEVDSNDAVLVSGWTTVGMPSGLSYGVTIWKLPPDASETFDASSSWTREDPNFLEYDGSSYISISSETLSNTGGANVGTVNTTNWTRTGPVTLSVNSYDITTP